MLDSQKLHILGVMKLNFGKTSLHMVILVEGLEAGIWIQVFSLQVCVCVYLCVYFPRGRLYNLPPWIIGVRVISFVISCSSILYLICICKIIVDLLTEKHQYAQHNLVFVRLKEENFLAEYARFCPNVPQGWI